MGNKPRKYSIFDLSKGLLRLQTSYLEYLKPAKTISNVLCINKTFTITDMRIGAGITDKP